MVNRTILGAVIWAVAFVLSSIVLKGNPLGDWIEGLRLVGWIAFISAAASSAARRKKDG